MSDSDLILATQASEDARNEEYRASAFQSMLEKLESLDSMEYGFEFVCKPSFLEGVSEAIAIM